MWPGTPILQEMDTSVDRDINIMKNENRIKWTLC